MVFVWGSEFGVRSQLMPVETAIYRVSISEFGNACRCGDLSRLCFGVLLDSPLAGRP